MTERTERDQQMYTKVGGLHSIYNTGTKNNLN